MRRILSVIALGAALGLSTMGFKTVDNVETSCEASNDLSVVAALDNMDVGMGEVTGTIVNSSDDNDYDEVMVRVEFHGAALESTDDIEDTDIDVERDLDVEGDVDVDLDDADIDVDADADINTTTETELEGESSLSLSTRSLGSKVFTVNEDVEAGESEQFELDITPPAGTTSITTTVICAD